MDNFIFYFHKKNFIVVSSSRKAIFQINFYKLVKYSVVMMKMKLRDRKV